MKKSKHICMALVIVLLFGMSAVAEVRTCVYHHLSNTYDFRIVYDKRMTTDSETYILSATVFVSNKRDHQLVQKIRLSDTEDVFFDFQCTSRSFITGYRKNAVVQDGDFGDIVVADFNFDGREDFALKKAQSPTGAGTEFFDFYLQNDKGKFIKDRYLSNKMMQCPSAIDRKRHILTLETPVAAGRELEVQKFRYDTITKKWTMGKPRYLK